MKRIENAGKKNPRLSLRQGYQSDGGTGLTQSGTSLLIDMAFNALISTRILISELHRVQMSYTELYFC